MQQFSFENKASTKAQELDVVDIYIFISLYQSLLANSPILLLWIQNVYEANYSKKMFWKFVQTSHFFIDL